MVRHPLPSPATRGDTDVFTPPSDFVRLADVVPHIQSVTIPCCGHFANIEAGSYRARLHAVGRDLDYDIVVEESQERHLVQFWRAPPANTIVLANASSVGKSLPRFVAMWQNNL